MIGTLDLHGGALRSAAERFRRPLAPISGDQGTAVSAAALFAGVSLASLVSLVSAYGITAMGFPPREAPV